MRTEKTRGLGPTVWIAVVAVVTIVLTIGPALFGRGVFFPGDIVKQVAPWQVDAPNDFQPQNRLLTDLVDGAAPQRTEVRRGILDGDYPLWNPYSAGGTPLGTQPQNGMFSPLHLPYLIFSPSYAPAVAKAVEMLVALLFTFLFLRRVGLGRPAALVGGVLYMNSAFLVVWSTFPHAEVAALIPALFWAAERVLARRSLISAFPVSVVIAVMLLQGFPSVAAYAGIAVACYVLMRLALDRGSSMRERIKVLARLGVALVLGVALSAIQLLPFVATLDDFDRTYRLQRSTSVLPVSSLVTVAVPKAFGAPRDHIDFAPRNQVEMQTFAGVTALVLMIGGFLRRPREGVLPGVKGFLWAGVAVLVVMVFMGGPLLSVFQTLLSPLFEENAVGRMRSVLGFFVASLAAVGFQSFVSSDRPRLEIWQRIVLGVGGLAALGGAAVGLLRMYEVARNNGHSSYFLDQLWIPGMAAAAVVIALVIGGRWRPGGQHVAHWVVPVAFAIESVAFASAFLPTVDRTDFYPVTPTHRYLAANIGHERMAAGGGTMWPGSQTFYRLRTVASHAFHPTEWRDLLEEVGVRGPETQPLFGYGRETASAPILDRLGAGFWVSRPEELPFGEPIRISPGSDRVVLRSRVPVRIPTSLEGIRAVVVRLDEAFSSDEQGAFMDAEVLARDGRVLARGERRIRAGQGPARIHVPVAEYRSSDGRGRPASIRLTLRSDDDDAVVLGTAGVPAVTAVVADDDGLRLTFADGAVVYRRLNALPRIHWASRTAVVPDPAERIRRLGAGVDPRTVLLSAAGPEASAEPALIEILADEGDEIRVRVRAEGRGYLVVADSISEGWHATVDGARAAIVDADHAVGAIVVPEGDHVVSLVYRPAGWRVGSKVSAASALVLAAGAVVAFRRRRRDDEAIDRPLLDTP
ncbi:MAG TPA: hypothetical protein VJ922_07150 [Actinomycetota bacterium]|nr:hypothetical protein [Actinomycetota bacterium]